MRNIHNYKRRVRYSEIDGMKRVHNSVYQVYFEEARVDLVRDNNYPYEDIENFEEIPEYLQTVFKKYIE